MFLEPLVKHACARRSLRLIQIDGFERENSSELFRGEIGKVPRRNRKSSEVSGLFGNEREVFNMFNILN